MDAELHLSVLGKMGFLFFFFRQILGAFVAQGVCNIF